MDQSLSKFQGCILGGMCGDVLGATVEGAKSDFIAYKYPNGLVCFDKYGSRPYGCYTDDSQMTLALLKSLQRTNLVCNAEDCARSYADHFQINRGYGETVFKIMVDLRNKCDYKTIANKYIPEGSYANGGAMRIAPIGLIYANRALDDMKIAVKDALLCTHTHPHGIEGATIQAAAISYLYKVNNFDVNLFLQYLIDISSIPDKLIYIRDNLRVVDQITNMTEYLKSSSWDHELAIRYVISERFQIKALDAVACAILAFCTHWRDPANAVVCAIHYGGDTDTIASMTGNLAFALWGIKHIPKVWLDNLEDRDSTLELCKQIYNHLNI
jgi:poly(ADP-ribose) glycohydrolase ARH3